MKNMVLTESHLHTCEISMCADVSAKKIPAIYKKAGYGNIIVTDHWNHWTLDQFPGNKKQKNKAWLKGYQIVKQEAEKEGIQVFLGMEMCVSGGPEDFLVYGLTEEFLIDYPDLYNYPLQDVYKVIDEAGMLLFQAHPFRPYLKVQDANYLHGVETFNGNPRHQNNNEKAVNFAEKNNLLRSSGSDFHVAGDESHGGIYLPKEVTDISQVVRCFKDGVTLHHS